MIRQKGLVVFLDGQCPQHFMFPVWAMEQVGAWVMEDAWHSPQGVRATSNPADRTIRFMIENNLFMLESYSLFPERAKGGAVWIGLSWRMAVTKGYEERQVITGPEKANPRVDIEPLLRSYRGITPCISLEHRSWKTHRFAQSARRGSSPYVTPSQNVGAYPHTPTTLRYGSFPFGSRPTRKRLK